MKVTRTLRLDDIHDALAGEKGRALTHALKDELVAHNAISVGETVDFKSETSDRFESEIARTLEGMFLLKSDFVAALPSAVTYVLSKCADENGMVDVKRVQKRFGNRVSTLLADLARTAIRDGMPTPRMQTKYAYLPDGVIDLMVKSAVKDDKRAMMPVVSDLVRLVANKKKLGGVSFAAVQHLFPSTEGLFAALVDCGLDPARSIVKGKNYSTNLDVMHQMRVDGFRVSAWSQTKILVSDGDTSREFDVLGPYMKETFAKVLELKEKDPQAFAALKPPQFLLLDEGGKMVKLLHKHFADVAHLCVAAEQTDRGIQVIDEMQASGEKLLCPVVNMARSQAKKIYEAPMIGESVVHSTMKALENIDATIEIHPKEATVIGYGAVGKATADALRRRGFTVYVYDIDDEKMKAAALDGCLPRPRDEALSHAHLLISCTGKTVMTPDQFEKLLPNHAVLVNAASSNHELGMDLIEGNVTRLRDREYVSEDGYRITKFNGRDVNLGDLAGNDQMCSRVVHGEDGSERLVLRSGYVVNMTDDIPPAYIQLTRALLLASCVQAVDEKVPGLIELKQEYQDFVVSRTKKYLAAIGHDLMAPDFTKLPA